MGGETQQKYQVPEFSANQFQNIMIKKSPTGKSLEVSEQTVKIYTQQRVPGSKGTEVSNNKASSTFADDSFGSDLDSSLFASPAGWKPDTSRKTGKAQSAITSTLINDGKRKVDTVVGVRKNSTVLGGRNVNTSVNRNELRASSIRSNILHRIDKSTNESIQPITESSMTRNTTSTNVNTRPGMNNAQLRNTIHTPASKISVSEQSNHEVCILPSTATLRTPTSHVQTPSTHMQPSLQNVDSRFHTAPVTSSGQSAAPSVINPIAIHGSTSTPSRSNTPTSGGSNSSKRKRKFPGPAGALPKLVSIETQL